MTMSIPVIQSLVQGQRQFIDVFETPAFERQRPQLLPPWFNQVEPAGILGNELNLDLRPGSQGQLDFTAGMNDQVVFNNQPALGRKLAYHLFQQLNVAGAVSAGT